MIKLVFSDYRYIILAAAIFVGMLIPLSIISEFIFFDLLFSRMNDCHFFGHEIIPLIQFFKDRFARVITNNQCDCEENQIFSRSIKIK